jgi:hypothetical protein
LKTNHLYPRDVHNPSSNTTLDVIDIDNKDVSKEIDLLKTIGYQHPDNEFKYEYSPGEYSFNIMTNADPIHPNSFDIDKNGNIYISLRSYDALVSININDLNNPKLN